MKISVIGAGYVGLVSGACLADKGHEVVCVDIDKEKVDQINNAKAPIYEKGLTEILNRTVGKTFFATTDLHRSVVGSQLTLVAVGTPFDGRNIDLSYIRAVSEQIGTALRSKTDYHAVVVKSTVVPGTTDGLVLPLLGKHSGKEAGEGFGVGMNPEFLTEGQAMADFMNPDRIVLGANDRRTAEILEELYDSFKGTPVVRTNCRTAEMIKYASNAMLAVQISFTNEIANLCSALGGIDVVDVMEGVHLSHYLYPETRDAGRFRAPISSFLEAGCGFGGSCLPKDVRALIAHGEEAGAQMPVLSAVMETNDKQYKRIIDLIYKHYQSLENLRVSILGLSFKPDTDDMRESPAIPIIRMLMEQGAAVKAYDPEAKGEALKIFGGTPLRLCQTLEEALLDIDVAALVTRWDHFKIVPDLLERLSPNALLVDGRRMIDKRSYRRYDGIGM